MHFFSKISVFSKFLGTTFIPGATSIPESRVGLLTIPSNVLPLHLKQTFLPTILIFTENEGIETTLPFKRFSTLVNKFFFFRYDSEYDDLRLASASAGGPLMSDVESDLPPELDIDLNNILDNVMIESTGLIDEPLADQEAAGAAMGDFTEDEAPISTLDETPISTLVDEEEEELPKKV